MFFLGFSFTFVLNQCQSGFMGNFSDHPINQNFGKVFKELSSRNAIKGKSDIAKKLDTYNHIINNILKGDRNITIDQILKLSNHYEINPNYLFGKSDQMFLEEDSLTTFQSEDSSWSKEGNISLVPLRAAAGHQIDLRDMVNQDDVPRFSLPGMSGELFAFEIDGDSMMPTITNGDLIICEQLGNQEPIKDNQVYVIISDIVVAKRIHQLKDDTGNLRALELISDNSEFYQPYEIELEEIRQILKVKSRLTSYRLV